LFLGAELTKVYANQYGSKIMPNADAELIYDEPLADQKRPPGSTGSV
jgi:hypothetical protein